MLKLRSLAKEMIFSISLLIVSPVLLLYWSLNFFCNTDSLFSGFSQFLSLMPGKTGNYLRLAFYRYAMNKCSKDAVVSFLVLFAQQDTEIDQGVYLGPNCNIGSCKIGKNTLIGSSVHVMSGRKQHVFDDVELSIKDQGGVLEKISIGEDCWLGNGAFVLANIGDKCVIGSGSVVVNDVPPYSIVAGNPAKIINQRKPSSTNVYS